MILNINNVNQHANKIHFKMDSLNTIIKLSRQGLFDMESIDAYYSVPIAAPYRKYLRFSWRGSLFSVFNKWTSFGPGKYTKLLKPVLSELHLKGHIFSGYFDDLYLQEATYKDCVYNVIDTPRQINSLGFIAHPDKSVFNNWLF